MLKARARRFLVVALIPITLSAASCDPLWKAQQERMGLTANEDGVPVIVAAPCPNERVAVMELLDPESVVEGNPTTYWRVRSDQAVVGKPYMVPVDNRPPAPFDLVVRLAGDLPADIPSLAGVGTLSNEGDRGGAAREFRIEELQVGEVLTRSGELVSPGEFMKIARDAC